MGVFSAEQTTTNQQAYNNQVGVSNRDLSGTQVTGASGANTNLGGALTSGGAGSNVGGLLAVGPGSNANVNISSLDASALQTAAFTINHALDVNAGFAQSALQTFQNSTSATSEHPTGPLPATTDANGNTTLAAPNPLAEHHIDGIVIAALVVVGGFIAYSYFKHRK